jgi:hypothetical protein
MADSSNSGACRRGKLGFLQGVFKSFGRARVQMHRDIAWRNRLRWSADLRFGAFRADFSDGGIKSFIFFSPSNL